MRTELLDPRTDDRWEEFVGRASGATMFHHPAWLGLLATSYRYDFAASCLVDDAGRVVAGLPWARVESRLTGRRLVALPFSDACPPLTDGAPEDELAHAVDEHRRATGLGLEVRWRMDGLGKTVHSYWRHTLQLEPDADAVARRASSGIRRGVAKARREGLVFERRTDAAALDAFYELHLQTRRHQGVPTQPKRFIDGLRRAVRARARLRRARERRRHARSRPRVFLQLRGHLIYKYGASDRSALARRPNNLLFAEVDPLGVRERAAASSTSAAPTSSTRGSRSSSAAWGAEELAAAPHLRRDGGARAAGGSRVQQLLVPVIRHSPAGRRPTDRATLYRHFG